MKRVAVLPLLLLCIAFSATAQFTDWSAPVNIGPVVNSLYLDSCVAISKDGLSLFFSSNRQAGIPNSMNRDLYVTKRATVDSAWEPPLPLTILNTPVWESCPALSLDEHRLYFTRPGSCGAQDIWVSRRHDRRDNFGWEAPIQLACESDGGVNSALMDIMPTFFEDDSGRIIMYFVRWGGANATASHLYQSVMREDGTFGPASPIPEVSTAVYFEISPAVRRDGLELIFTSNRPNGTSAYNVNSLDFWMASRVRTADPWSSPVFISSLGNPAWSMGRTSLSFDGRELYFAVAPPGVPPDLCVAKREKLRGNSK